MTPRPDQPPRHDHSTSDLGSDGSRSVTAIGRAGLGIAGGFLILTGGLILIAWATGSPEFVQLDLTLPAPHYNTAFGFLLWGAGYCALACGWYRQGRFAAIAITAIGIVTAVGTVVDIGLNHWLFTPTLPHLPSPPGGCAPGMSVGLCLAAVAILLITYRPYSVVRTRFITLIAVVLCVGSPALFLAARMGIANPRGGHPTAFGAIGTAVAGFGLLAVVFRAGRPVSAIGRVLPILVGSAGVIITAILGTGLQDEQNRRVQRQVQFEADHIRRTTAEGLRREQAELAELAERWLRLGAEDRKTKAGEYVGSKPACIAMARLDPELSITWVETRIRVDPETSLTDLGVSEMALDDIRRGKPVVIRPPRSHSYNQWVFILFTPHLTQDGSAGGLLSVHLCGKLFETILGTNTSAGYAIEVNDGGGSMYNRYGNDDEYQARWGETLPLSFEGFDWSVTVWPTADVLTRESLSLPRLALVFGLITTTLLAVAVRLAQTARRRAAALEVEVRERELTQRALKQSEEKYRTLIENLGQGIFLQDSDHRYVAANTQFCRSLDRAESEIVGRTESELFDPQRATVFAADVTTVLTDGRQVESEEEVVDHDRRLRVRRVLTPVRDVGGRITGVLGICWDVTEQRQFEAHIHQASKMDAIGQLAGGIAHDFNNLLTAILGNLELVLPTLPFGHSARGLVESAITAASRSASLTRRLLGFSRQHQLDWVATDVNQIVEEVVALLRRTIDPLIRIEVEIAAEGWSVRADGGQLNQVLMNLCLNARDAISGDGRIRVETACVTVGSGNTPEGPAGRVGEFVRVRVSDSGAGMSDEVKARMYEPFFTTKEVGKGTGLGLPMVFAIVRQHQGWIECHSGVGQGTRFDIYLPRSEAAKVVTLPQTNAPAGEGGDETILVVEDEEMVRRLAVATLQSHGYTVIEASDGQEGVDIYSRERDRIDLVLLDLTMPVLSGHETFRHLLRINPHVKVIFASGYAVENLSDLEKERMAGFVKKPYRPNDLIVTLGMALRSTLVDGTTSEVEYGVLTAAG